MTGEVVEKHAGMVHDWGMGGWGVGMDVGVWRGRVEGGVVVGR